MKDVIFSMILLNGPSGMKNNVKKTAFIVMSNACNENCPYCFNKQSYFKIRTDKITPLNYELIIKKIKQLNVTDVVLTGGEPLIFKKLLFKIIKSLAAANIEISLDTNGTLFDSTTINQLKRLGLKNIYLSSKYIYKIKSWIIEELNQGFDLTIIHVLTKKNFNRSSDLLKRIRNKNIKTIVQPVFVAEDHRKFNTLSIKNLSPKDRKMATRIIKDYSYEPSGIYIRLINDLYMGSHAKFFPKKCHMGENDLIIYSDGEVYPCFHRQDLQAGNILKDNIRKIKNNLHKFSLETNKAKCFGEHCISLFY
jgi:MoaA/NifB/PqqE/SkfB family radical SAM enzyme